MLKKSLATLVFGALLIGGSLNANSAETYKMDEPHISIYYKISHFGWSDLMGRFNTASGEFTIDEENPENASANIEIIAASIDTNHQARDDHLRSPDFFNAEEFPTITFASTKVEKTGDRTGRMTGDLTLLGVTKPITFDFEWNERSPHFSRKEEIHTGFSAVVELKRSEWGMEKFIPGIGDDVTLFIEIEGIKQ